MTTKTELCNRALAIIGGKLLSDFATDVTSGGQLCRLFFDDSVDELLELYPWTFAMRRATLSAALQDVPLFGFAHAYQLPPDCVKVWETDLMDVQWRVEDDHLLTDYSPVHIGYTVRVADTAVYSAGFRQALHYLLAAKLAVPIARSVELATLYHGKVREITAVGQGANATSSNESYEPDLLIDVRH